MKLGPLTGKQRAAWWALEDHRTVLCEGAVRSGKSVGMDHAFLDFALNGPEGNLFLAGRTQDSVYRNVIEPLVRMDKCVAFNRGTRELRIGGRLIFVFGANDERAQEKMRGPTFVGGYVDEATTIPESFWSMALTRLSVDGARLMATTNPDAPLHWLKRKFIDRAGELDLAHFHFRVDDNPYLSPSYVAALRAEHTGLFYRRFIEGEWVAAEGAVYDMLDVSPGGRHVTAEIPEDAGPFVLVIDPGTTNPTHALLGCICELDDRPAVLIVREWRYAGGETKRRLTDVEVSQRLEAWLQSGADGLTEDLVPVSGLVIDPAGTSLREQLQRDGWGWAVQADNAVIDGIRATASLLATGRLVIHESCVHLLRELSGYVWDPKAQARGEDAPLKIDDHGPDALRYLVMYLRRHWRHWLHAYEPEEAAA